MKVNGMRSRHLPDMYLLLSLIVLLLIGLLMVYSSSYVWAAYKFADPFYYAKRQLLFASLGIVGAIVVYHIPIHHWKRYIIPFFIACILLLLAVLVPGIGIIRGGAQSWIGIGAFSIQPSEFMKLGLIIFLAHYLSKEKRHMQTFFRGFLVPIAITISLFGVIMLQPDFGTGIVLTMTAIAMIFIAGARLSYFIYLCIAGVVGLSFLILSAPYRINRITAYLNPWDDPLGDGFQIIQSLYAVGPGQLLGTGFTKSIQKYFYLPEPQTDFIYAIISEEFGFIGALFVLLLFLLVTFRGIKVALATRDFFLRYIAFGIVVMIAIQVMINVSVVIGLIPVTGITLPFLSYGGSSLTLTLCSLGLLLQISTYTQA